MLPDDGALAVTLGHTIGVALGDQHPAAGQRLHVVRAAQSIDRPAFQTVFAEFIDAATHSVRFSVSAVVIDSSGLPSRRLVARRAANSASSTVSSSLLPGR